MGQLEQMIAYHKAHGMLEDMSNDRAEEMQARKPNMTRRQVLLNTVPAELEGLKGGGRMGLQRVVGGARKMRAADAAVADYMEAAKSHRGKGKLVIEHGSDSDSEEEEEMEEKDMKGGFLPLLATIAMPLLGKLFGNGKAPLKRGKEAHAMGRELGQHLKTLHGEGFLDDLVSGIGSVVGKIFGAGLSGGAADSTLEYRKGIARRAVVPNGIAAKGQQVPDYAPNWFRESGDIAGGAKAPVRTMGYEQTKKVMEAVRAAQADRAGKTAPPPIAGSGKRKLSDRQVKRNALVKKLMTEKGMKLGEASAYIKAHNLI
jgi:hypothetical protein